MALSHRRSLKSRADSLSLFYFLTFIFSIWLARLAFSKLMKALESAKTFWSTTQLVQVNDEKQLLSTWSVS